VRFAVAILLLAACGSKPPNGPGDATGGDDTIGSNDALGSDDASSHSDATVGDATIADASPDAATIDAFPGVLDVHIDCHNDCVLHANPSSINVSAGTGFEVNWINVGDTECDVAKIDQFNQVPIIIGLEPGTSYHDPVHTWCGPIFTGTFEFRISICTLPSFIPVNCGA
jgi:hypothetical protein